MWKFVLLLFTYLVSSNRAELTPRDLVMDWINNNPTYSTTSTEHWKSFEYYDYNEDGYITTYRYIKGVHFHVPYAFTVFYQLGEETSTICIISCFSDTLFVASPEYMNGYIWGYGRPVILHNAVYFRMNVDDNTDNITVDDLDFPGWSEDIFVDGEEAILTHRCWNDHGSVCLIDVHVPLEDKYYIFSTNTFFTERTVELFNLFLSTIVFE